MCKQAPDCDHRPYADAVATCARANHNARRGRGREEVGEEKGGRKWSDDLILPGRVRAVESRRSVQVVYDGTVRA